MKLVRKKRPECQSIRDTAKEVDHADAFWRFRNAVSQQLSSYGVCTSEEEFSADFFIQNEDDDYDIAHVIVVVSMHGRAYSRGLLENMSDWIQKQTDPLPIFFDAQVDHGRPFEIAVLPNGDVWGSEDAHTDFIHSLGFEK